MLCGLPKPVNSLSSRCACLQLGKVVHWDFQNALFHPLHLHVTPFQIAKLYEDELEPGLQYSSWFEVSWPGCPRGVVVVHCSACCSQYGAVTVVDLVGLTCGSVPLTGELS